jgi:polyhydroxybutyrate depolymerase
MMLRHRTAARGAASLLSTLMIATVPTGCDDRRANPEPNPNPTAAAAPVGTSKQTIKVDGKERSYLLRRPAGLPSGPAPLVVMLHGAVGTGEQAESSYGWDDQADRGHFLVAYPDGIHRAWAVSHDCCGAPARDGIDDVKFIEQMVSTIAEEAPVDRSRVYAAGISNGGMLAYRLACGTSTFAAVGVVSGTLTGDCPNPRPISVIHLHGAADKAIPYDGGPGKWDNDGTGWLPAKIDGPPVSQVLARWRRTDDCAPPTVTVKDPVTTSLAACPAGRAVALITIAGAGHQWPGSPGPNPDVQRLLGLDKPSTALDATATIWQFFAAHPRHG